MKNLFKILANTKAGQPTRTLIILYKSLIQSKIDYGLIAYGKTSKTTLGKLEIAQRAIISVILGSKISTPRETLYVESASAPSDRRKWLTRKYLTNLSHKGYNPMYSTQKRNWI